jgi:DNA-binding response OmpR family regulator
MAHRVLVVEDDPDIGRLVSLQLAECGCESRLVNDGVTALAAAETGGFDLVVLDLILPRMDGLEVCRRLRTLRVTTPILMMTAKSTVLDRVQGLDLGADDYLTKPFSMLEFAARAKALLRRTHELPTMPPTHRATGPLSIDLCGLQVDTARHEVRVEGEQVELTVKEFELLVYFVRSPGRVHTRAQLLDQVWGYGCSAYEHTVSSHINRLRRKIERDPTKPEYVQTVWGLGYRFSERRTTGAERNLSPSQLDVWYPTPSVLGKGGHSVSDRRGNNAPDADSARGTSRA